MPRLIPRTRLYLDQDPETLSKLRVYLREAKMRGIDVTRITAGRLVKFPVDENGYFRKDDGSTYKPNENQERFVNSNARFCALISGRGGGKTAAGAQKALRKIQEGKDGAILNPDFENFKVSTWNEFRKWIPWGMVVPAHRRMRDVSWEPHKPFTLAFVNGVRVICKGLKDPDSARGPNINWLWYDEAGRDKDGVAWQLSVASVRVGDFPQAWVTTTPAGKTHWIYDFFVDRKISDDALKLFSEVDADRELVETFFTSTMENADNLDPGFLASLLAAYPSGYLRNQELYGKFLDPEGTLGNRSWFEGKILQIPPDKSIMKRRIRFWDLAASEKKLSGRRKRVDPDETVGTLVSTDGEFLYVENQIGGCWEWYDIKQQIISTAVTDGYLVDIYIEQEPASGGKNQVAELHDFIRRELPGHPGVHGYRPEGDRVMLANFWFSLAAQGKMFLVNGDWNELFLDQLSVFPEGKHDDRITSVSGAVINLMPVVKKYKAIEFLHL